MHRIPPSDREDCLPCKRQLHSLSRAGKGHTWRASARHFLTSSAFTSGRAESWMATKAALWFETCISHRSRRLQVCL